jgi:sortase (surface protein transpeptidase)
LANTLIVGGVLGALSGGYYLNSLMHTVTTPKLDQPAPSMTQPDARAISSYTTPAEDPRYISIRAINVPVSRVISYGVLADHRIAAPTNIYDAGWYNASAKPGQAGAMFIYGHLDSWTTSGLFANLKDLKPGDSVTVERGDGKTYTYRVVTSRIYPVNNVNMAAVLAPINPNVPGLNLMTCAGSIISHTAGYSERLVVFANLD